VNRDNAVRLLRHRLGGLNTGKPGGPSEEERLTFEDLASDYLEEREVRGAKGACLQWSKSRVANLKTFFDGMRVSDITTHRMREYARKRLALGAAPGTVNRDFGALSRMFTLAIQAGRMTRRPFIPRLRENPPRQGFMKHGEYLAIREHLPAAYQDVLDFGYLSGWRKGEVLTLEWRDVDRDGRSIRLRPEVSKTREGRVLVLSTPLQAVIERRWHARALRCPLVFHEAARSLQGFKNAWERACKAAGAPGKLFHDLRRTAIRNLIRAGVPERVAMQVSGHKTRSILDRYNIVSEGDLQQASERLTTYLATRQVGVFE
jgi:integrase